MNRTRPQTVAGFFLVALIFVYAFASYLNTSADLLLPIGNITIFTFALVDLLVLGWVFAISPRLPKVTKKDNAALVTASSNPLPPLAAARTVAFALAGSRVGSLLAGGYLGLGIVDFQKLHAVAYLDHAKRSLLMAVLSLGLVLVSIWLERKCSPPKPNISED